MRLRRRSRAGGTATLRREEKRVFAHLWGRRGGEPAFKLASRQMGYYLCPKLGWTGRWAHTAPFRG